MFDFSAIAILIVVAIAIVIVSAFTRKGGSARYQRRPLMTGNEREFFRRLTDALGGQFHIFPQVSMGAIIEPVTRDKKRRLADFRRISQKRMDYLICDRDMSVVAVIELDDRTHSPMNDNRRDDFLGTAGIRTIRFRSKQKPSVAEIRIGISNLRTAA